MAGGGEWEGRGREGEGRGRPASWKSAPSIQPTASHFLLPQEKVSSAAPPGWSIELVDMSFGTDAPKTSNYRVSGTGVRGCI